MKPIVVKWHTVLFIWVFWGLIDSAQADFSFIPRLETGVMDYTFESKAVSLTRPSQPFYLNSGNQYTQGAFEYNDRLPVMGVGATLFWNRLYLDISGHYAFDGDDITAIPFSSYQPARYDADNDYIETDFLALVPIHRVTFDRRDEALSLGFGFDKHLSIFLGYKRASTEFSSTYRGPFHLLPYVYNDDGSKPSPIFGTISGNTRYDFTYAGPFMGVIQGWDFTRGRFLKGSLTANLALARLDGKVNLKESVSWIKIDDQNVDTAPVRVEGDSIANRYDSRGIALGITLGFGWQGSTGVEGLSYNLNLSGYRYEFEAKDNGQSDINETAILFKVGLSYLF